MRKAGQVYCMVDQHGRPKVGYTTWAASIRCAQLNRYGYRLSDARVPGRWRVIRWRAVGDAPAAEARCHRLLADYRISRCREIFKRSPAKACEVIDAVWMGHRPTNPNALEYMAAGGLLVLLWAEWAWIEPWVRWLEG